MIGSILTGIRSIPTIRYAVVGVEASGKSTLHKSIRKNLAEVWDGRNPTKVAEPRHRAMVKIPGAIREKTSWEGEDYPHHAEMVVDQILSLYPRIIFIIVDHERALHPANDAVITAVSEALASEEYQKKTHPVFTYKWPTNWKILKGENWTRKGFMAKTRCSNVVIVYNKMDTIPNGTNGRIDAVHGALNHYLKDDGPLAYIRDKYSLQFVAASLKWASYVPISDLGGNPRSISELFSELLRRSLS